MVNRCCYWIVFHYFLALQYYIPNLYRTNAFFFSKTLTCEKGKKQRLRFNLIIIVIAFLGNLYCTCKYGLYISFKRVLIGIYRRQLNNSILWTKTILFSVDKKSLRIRRSHETSLVTLLFFFQNAPPKLDR